jgi:hypothetical protein
MKMLIGKLHFELTSFIRLYPSLFFPLMQLNKRLRRIPGGPLVTRDTELVIEGFFRCGNTFAAIAFLECQDQPVTIANHSHSAATIIRASKLGIPALVLIREPGETIPSLLLKHPHVSMRQALRAYIHYHNKIRPYRQDFVIATLKETTTDYGLVIERVNRRFGTDFTPFHHTEDTVKRVFERIENVDRIVTGGDSTKYSIPNADKVSAKSILRHRLGSRELKPLFDEAQHIYDGIISETRVSTSSQFHKASA